MSDRIEWKSIGEMLNSMRKFAIEHPYHTFYTADIISRAAGWSARLDGAPEPHEEIWRISILDLKRSIHEDPTLPTAMRALLTTNNGRLRVCEITIGRPLNPWAPQR